MAVRQGVSLRRRLLIGLGVVAVLWVGGILLVQPSGSALTMLVRALALLGYLCVFLAVLSSLYLRELVKAFGRPFIQLHHVVSVTGLVALTLHPIGAALDWGLAAVLDLHLDSLYAFLQWGGRYAWVLIAIAALAAALRSRWLKTWRVLHYLNYIAFLIATLHALLLGGSFQTLVPRLLVIAMALIVVAVFVRKRMQAAQRAKTSTR